MNLMLDFLNCKLPNWLLRPWETFKPTSVFRHHLIVELRDCGTWDADKNRQDG